MTYNEYIQNIIETRGQWNPPSEFWEGHHISPVCEEGKGEYRSKDDNIVWLTLQEHYEAHKLLALENPNNTFLQRAWYMMSHREGVKVSSEEYELSKKSFIKSISGDNSPNKREDVRQHLREGAAKRDKSTYRTGNQKGEHNGNYGKHTLAGKNHFYYGKHRDKSVCEKVSKTRIERGVAKGKNNPRARQVKCVELDIVYDTGVDAAKSVDGSKSGICTACKTGVVYKGYHWCYYSIEV